MTLMTLMAWFTVNLRRSGSQFTPHIFSYKVPKNHKFSKKNCILTIAASILIQFGTLLKYK